MRKGFTLVELTVATAVVGVLIVLMMTFLTDKLVDNAIKNARSNLQHETRLTLDVINRDIKHSANVDELNRWPDAYAPAPGDDYSWTSDNDTLVLAHPAQDDTQNFVYEDPLTYITYKNDYVYFLDGTTLYKRILAAPVANNRATTTCPPGTAGCPADIVLARNVTDFTLSYYDGNDQAVAPGDARSVGVTLKVLENVFNRPVEVEYSIIRTVFRNE